MFLAAILNGGHFEDVHRPKIPYTQLLCDLLAYIYDKQASNLLAKIIIKQVGLGAQAKLDIKITGACMVVFERKDTYIIFNSS